MENLPFKLIKNFNDFNFIVLYPHQKGIIKNENNFYQSTEFAYNSYINNTERQRKESFVEDDFDQQKRK